MANLDPKYSINTIHIIQAAYNLPNHCVDPRTQTTTSNNTSSYFLRLEINLTLEEKFNLNQNELKAQLNNYLRIIHSPWVLHAENALLWDCPSEQQPATRCHDYLVKLVVKKLRGTLTCFNKTRTCCAKTSSGLTKVFLRKVII